MRPVARAIDACRCEAHGSPGVLLVKEGHRVRVNGHAVARFQAKGWTFCAGHEGPGPFWVIEAATTVRVGKEPISFRGARTTLHGNGVIATGSPNVRVGGGSLNLERHWRVLALARIQRAMASLDRWDPEDEATFRRWFGDTSPQAKSEVRRSLELIRQSLARAGFGYAPDEDWGSTPARSWREFSVGDPFYEAGGDRPGHGHVSGPGVLVHEASHLNDGPNARDHAYDPKGCEDLAQKHPDLARKNADSYEHYVDDAGLEKGDP